MNSNEWREARKHWVQKEPARQSSRQDLFIKLALIAIIVFELASILYNVCFVVSYSKMEARYVDEYGNWLGSLVAVHGWQTSGGYVWSHIIVDALSLSWVLYIFKRYWEHRSIPNLWMIFIVVGSLYTVVALPDYKEHLNDLKDFKEDMSAKFNVDLDSINIEFNLGSFLFFYEFYFELIFIIVPAIIVLLIVISQNVSSAGRVTYK